MAAEDDPNSLGWRSRAPTANLTAFVPPNTRLGVPPGAPPKKRFGTPGREETTPARVRRWAQDSDAVVSDSASA